MAIALDVATNGSFVDPGTSRTWSHTCTGSNLVLGVGINTQAGGGADVVTGVTYNSVSMTRADESTNSGTSRTYLYILTAPSTGANNIVASLSSSVSAGFLSASYTGCAQTGQPDESNSAVSSGASNVSASIGSQASGSWIIGCCQAVNGSAASYVGGANTTIRVNNDGYPRFAFVDSNGNTTTSLTYSWTGSDDGLIVIAEILQAGGAPPDPLNGSNNFLGLLGVGT